MELLLWACLIESSSTCQMVKIPVHEEAHIELPTNCAQTGMLEAVKWMEAHPKWKVERWTCSRLVQEQDI